MFFVKNEGQTEAQSSSFPLRLFTRRKSNCFIIGFIFSLISPPFDPHVRQYSIHTCLNNSYSKQTGGSTSPESWDLAPSPADWTARLIHLLFYDDKRDLVAFRIIIIILSLGCLTGKVAFVQLADLLNIEVITLKSRPHPLRSICPALYLSAPSRLLCRLVQHRWDGKTDGRLFYSFES